MTTKKRHVSFYIDNDLVDLLNREPNKSRAINNALRVRFEAQQKDQDRLSQLEQRIERIEQSIDAESP